MGEYREFSGFLANIARLGIAGSYFVDKCAERTKNNAHVGLMVKAIVEEIKRGAFQKNSEGYFLEAPNFMCVRELTLSSTYVKARYGKADYHPHNHWANWFTYWYRQEGRMFEGDPNFTTIHVDSAYRAVVMPSIPGFDCVLTPSAVASRAARKDVKFFHAQHLQHNDPGFRFQGADVRLDYFDTEVKIKILQDKWTFIFPWSNTQAVMISRNQQKLAAESNKELKRRLKYLSYDLKACRPGRQVILLPAVECPVNLTLDCLSTEVTWFVVLSNVEHFDLSALENIIKLYRNYIEVGNEQIVKFIGSSANILLVIPKYMCSASNDVDMAESVTAYFEVRQNRLSYTSTDGVAFMLVNPFCRCCLDL